jgi:hypothetical protein
LVLLLLLPPSSSLPLLAGGMMPPLSHPASLYNHKNRGHQPRFLHIATSFLSHSDLFTQESLNTTTGKRKHKRLQLTGGSGHGNGLLREKMEVDREEDVAKCRQADE